MGNITFRSSNIRNSAKSEKITERDKKIFEIKCQRDNLKMYNSKLEKYIESVDEMIKQLVTTKRKEKAIHLLKIKKFRQKLLEKGESMLQQLEIIIADVEMAEINYTVVDSLVKGLELIKELNNKISVNDINNLISESNEMSLKNNELMQILMTQLNESDLNEIEAELNQMNSFEKPIISSQKIIDNLPDISKVNLDDIVVPNKSTPIQDKNKLYS